MPGAPRFTQKPSIKQTPTGDLLMECVLEADPRPEIVWQHSGTPMPPSSRAEQELRPQPGANLFLAILTIKEPNAGDGGAYRCTAKNVHGESNANINLNFAGGGEEPKARGPSFVGKPRIIPMDGGARIVMECRVKSSTTPTAKWSKDGSPISGSQFHEVFQELGDSTYLCQLEIHGPSTSDAGQYRCTLKNAEGETNANLALNFEEPDDEAPPPEEKKKRKKTERSPSGRSREGSASPRPGSPSKKKKERSGSERDEKRRRSKSKEASPGAAKGGRSRTSTPMGDELTPDQAKTRRGSSKLTDEDKSSKRLRERSQSGLAAEEKKSRSKSPQAEPQQSESSATTRQTTANELPANAREKFKRAPVVVEPASSKSARRGGTVTLEVEWQCHTSTRVTWYKDGSELSSYAREYSQTFDGQYSRLTISDLSSKLTGVYKCIAKSDYGEGQSQAVVRLEEEEKSKAEDDTRLKSEDERGAGGRKSPSPALRKKSPTPAEKRGTSRPAGDDEVALPPGSPDVRAGRRATVAHTPEFLFHGLLPYSRVVMQSTRRDPFEVFGLRNGDADTTVRRTPVYGRPPLQPTVATNGHQGQNGQQQPLRRPTMNTRGLSHIHSFILKKLPHGDAKQTFLKVSEADGIPSSGLTIPESRRRELMGEADGSEDEFSESISELPSFAGGTPKMPRKRVSTPQEPPQEEKVMFQNARDLLKKTGTATKQGDAAQSKPTLKKVGPKPADDPHEFKKPLLKKVAKKDPVEGPTDPSKVKLKKVERRADSSDPEAGGSSRKSSFGGDSEADPKSRLSGRRGSVDLRRESISELLEKAHTPLKAQGGPGAPAKIIEFDDSVTVLENETAALTIKVAGDPVPTIKWKKGLREVMSGGRFKQHTNGEENKAHLAVSKCRNQDDGVYSVTVSNAHGSDTAEIKLLVTNDNQGGADFRAMLKRRDTSAGQGQKEPKEKELSEAERRQSLFPGKRVEQWVEPLQEKKAQQVTDKIVEWKCTYSRTNAKIRWYKDRKEIFSGGLKYKIIIEKATCTLIINNPEVDDSGMYMCEANGVKTQAMLTVEEPPMKYSFVNPLPNTQEVYRTKQGVLTCKVNSARAPLKWYHRGKLIDENDPRFNIDKDPVGRCTITIHELRQEDEGEWMAYISDDVLSKMMVYVEEPRDTFVIPLKSQRVDERGNTSLECDVNDKDAVVQWWHDGVRIDVDGVHFKEEKSMRKRRLHIFGARIEDHGEYKCTTKDDKTMAQLIVEPLNKFIVPLKDIEVVEKETVDLRCETKDTKTPGTWFVKGKPISSKPGGKFECQSRNGVHTLKISKIEMSEGDTYEFDQAGLHGQCVVSVVEGEKKPTFNWKPKTIEAKAHEPTEVRIPFSIKGQRTLPKIRLLKNGQPVDLDKLKNLIEVVIEGDEAVIKFKDPTMADSGKWALELGNSAGTALAPFELLVKDKPKPPKGPLETTNVTAEGCDLKWGEGDKGDENPAKAFIVEMQEGRSGNWQKIGETKGAGFKVKDLKEHGEYKFRVKAVNDAGISDPLTGETILAKNPYTVPGKPRNMDFTDVDNDHITVAWDPPESDGGAPVEEYIIERREKSEKDWNRVGTVPHDAKEAKQTFTDERVVEGKEYYYRIKAVNKAGPGDPNDHGRSVKAKAKPSEPKFIKGGIKDQRLKVGETIKYDVPISGEPTPEVSWVVNGKPLKAGGRVKVTTERGRHVLKIENAERGDSGKFTIQLKNPSGTCEDSAIVTVVGRPAPPEGPLSVDDICADGATVGWKPPKDDGGDPLTGYIVEAQDLDQKGKFVEVGKVGPGETKLKVKGLKNKGNYKFRVKAVNGEGESEPLTADDYTTIKDPWDEPGKPGRPMVTDYDADRIDLAWDPPLKDGGAPIEEYIVEVRDPVTKEWKEVMRSPTTQASVKGLKEGQEYQFRVKAVNKAGPGQPSEPSEKQMAKPKFVPAWLKHECLRSLTVKAGQSVRWDVKIGGEPAPDVTWTRNDKPFDTNARVTVETKKSDHTILCISAAARGDIGEYRLTVKNAYGEDTEMANLTVLDRPAKPEGPLEVSNVFEDNCDLSWKPPKDDGGEPIEYYEVEKLDTATGRWVPCAKVKDTKAHIEGLKKGNTYQFRVKAVNKEGASEALNADKDIKAKNPYDEPGKPDPPEITDWDSNKVSLAWEPPASDGGAPITGYIIEKKSKHGRDWQECAKVGPQCEADVLNLKEGEEYQFRIKAVNKAGPGEASDPSQKVVAKPRNLKPWIDREAMKTITVKVGQDVEFDVPVRGEPPPEKTWTFADGKPISDRIRLTNEDYRTQFVLKGAQRKEAGKYTLVAQNASGKDTHSVEVIVLGKPSAPMGPLDVTDVFEDHCTLEWAPPEDDGGTPVDHYEIEKMDMATGRWVPCGRADGTTAQVHNLQPGHEYKFRVKAVNKEGESEPLTADQAILAKNPYDLPGKVDKPELVDWDKDHVDLKWNPVADDGGAPIDGYIIEKKDKRGRWEEAMVVPGDATTATVDGLKEGEEYQFRVRAKNKAGKGEASDPTDTVIAKCRNMPPHIHREDIEDHVVRVGGAVDFKIHIDGEPAPTVTWSFTGGSIHATGVQTDDQDYLSRFCIPKALRKQSGKYTITASNCNGSDSVTFEVKVKGKPGKPKGPLDVADVFEDSCNLAWEAPEDDGGEPIQFYEVEKMNPKDGLWVPCGRTADTQFHVDTLNKGDHYKFRVKAVNSEGASDPLENENEIVAKNPYERPDKPGKPEPTDWDYDHVDLKWDPPASDGGAPIEEYQVEKRTKYGRWEPAITVPGNQTTATVPDLTANEEYEFRIVAVNKGGPSDPSDPSRPVIAKPKNLAPKIDLGALKDITIRAGQILAFDVPVEGEPTPTMSWSGPGGKELRNGGRIKLDDHPNMTKFQMRQTERSDTGKYTLRAQNENGSDSASCMVTVIDKPSPPQGPLDVSNIQANQVTLDWKPPEDDGGVPIENYVIEKFDTSQGRWVPALKVPGGQTTADVDNLLEGHEYKFRVAAVNSEGESIPLETFSPIIAKNPYDKPGKPGQPEPTDWDKDHVDLKWTPPKEDGGAPIEGYIIEVKDEFSPNWKEAKTVPAGQTEASVTGLREGEKYQFRIRAKNKAGAGDPSDPSDPVTCKPRHLTPLIDKNSIHEIRVRAGQGCDLAIPVGGEPPPQITWTFEGEPVESDDRIRVQTEDYKTKFAIRKSKREDAGTYLITAKNESGVDTAEVKVIVLDHPSKPKGPLKVSNVTKNSCELDWKPPEDDGGADISHYQIEKQDQATGRWVPCGESQDTHFKVNDLTPGHEYKFRVKAVNRYGDSDPLEADASIIAKDPFDTAGKPGMPEITDWDKDRADLKWEPPADDGGAPVEEYLVEMRDGNGNWVEAAVVPADQTTASVKGLKEGHTYQFRVKAINKAGQSAPSDPSRHLLAKARHVAPKIDRKMFEGIKVRAGQPIKFDVNVDGEPHPEILWFFNGQPLRSADNTKIDNSADHNTKLTTKDSQRSHAGKYKIVATNDSGKDEEEVEVIVLDVPSDPKGPLHVDDITKDSAVVSWREPEDDGGSPITGYIVEKQEDGGRWVPCGETSGQDTQLKVGKLNEGHEYKFRVRAVNRQGQSGNLESPYPITAKNPFDEPDPPTDVKAVDWDKDHVDLQWKAPINDGGAPIEKYIVEKKDKYGDWVECAVVPGDQTKATAPNLTPGETYEFRVKAVNKAGPSKPSEGTGPIVARARRQAPKINLDGLADIRVKAGSPIKIEVTFEGAPEPKASWRVGDGSPDDRAEIKSTPTSSTILIPASRRSDSGPFTITVENEFGKDSGKCNVIVLDVPEAPQGPMKIGDIHKEGCTLHWKPPADDGGSEILHYVVEKMDTTRGTWQEVGQFPDCEAKVTKLHPGKEYLFRVKAVNLQGESKPLEAEEPIIAKNRFEVPDAPDKPQVTDWDKDRIDIKWEAPVNNGGSPIKGYIVEKKEKGSAMWTEAGRPSGTAFSATNLKPNVEYEFRVKAINEAGESAPSDPTDPQITRPRFQKPQILTKDKKAKVRAGHTHTMEIEFLGSPEPTAVWTLNGKEVPADLMVDKKTGKTSIFFPSAKREHTGTYKLKLKNDVGEDEGDFEVTIQDRPSPPEGPIVVEDVNKDSCTLHWKPPKDDGGSEITNYVVEKRDVKTGTWVPVSNFVAGTTCIVPKLQEGHEYEFRVSAQNVFGISDPLTTEDTVVAKDPFGTPGKPSKPSVVDTDNDHITIEWDPPRDNGGSPISHYDVERKDAKSGRWIKCNTQPVSGTEFRDDRVQKGHTYEYRVVAVNKAGPGEPSDPSDPATAKPMFEVPSFDLGIDGKEFRVKAGDPLLIQIPFSGSPKPEITWTREGKELSNIDTTDSITQLHILTARRSDEGPVKIRAVNKLGEAEANIKITVIDRPAPPEHLIYPEIGRRHATLKWDPPKDDGGAEIIGYKIEFQQEGSMFWEKVPQTVAQTQYTVRGLEHGARYRFRIRAENMAGLSDDLTGIPIVIKDNFDPPGPPTTPEITGYDTNTVSLKWNPPREDGGAPIQGYVIERFEKKGGGDWAPIRMPLIRGTETTIRNLFEGETYQFRVRAVNAAGEGAPSNGSEPVTCRPFVQPPGAPEAPHVGKTTKNSAELSWMRPTYDGGAPIDGYIVEKRKVGDKSWTRCNEKPVKEPRTTVEGLKEKDEYEFRVIAVNSAGEGEPSRPSDPVVIQEAPGRPVFDLSGLRDIVVRAGETIEIKIPFSGGNPKPTIDVFNGTQPVYEDARTTTEVMPDHILITTTASKRADGGPYKIRLSNRFGQDEAKLNVTVLDAPGKPTGPITATDVSGEEMTLHWRPPKEDGGAPVTNYIVEARTKNGEWKRIGQPIGTHFKARNLNKNQDYEFRVSAENQFGVGEPLESDDSFRAKDPFDPPGTPGRPEPMETNQDSILLTWTRPYTDGGAPIQGYYLEKREKGGDWERVQHGLISETRFKAYGLTPKKEYEFRVCAVNAAGSSDYSENSMPVVADSAPSRPKIDMGLLTRDIVVYAGETGKILVPFAATPMPRITWSKNGQTIDKKDPRAIVDFNDYLATLTYNKAQLDDTGSYTITLENSMGSDSATLKFKVVDRPAAPEGPLEISDICPDGCLVSWKEPKSDGGSPITNYILEKMHIGRGNENWEKVSSFVRNTSMYVSGLHENEKYRFRVRAENQYGVSEPLENRDPITARFQFNVPDAPDQPAARDMDKTWVDLSWDTPNDGGSKILGYIVQYRDASAGGKWMTAGGGRDLCKENNLRITGLRDCGEYEFRVQAKNAAGLSRHSPIAKLVLKSRIAPPGPPTQPAANSIGRNHVTLTWGPPIDDGGSKITGYHVEMREYGSSNWYQVSDYNILEPEFTVPNLKEFHDYEFRIVAENKAGRGFPSLPTAPIKIQEMGGSRPEIVVKPEDQVQPYNRRAVFVCEAIGRPKPTARWLRNGRELPESTRYRFEAHDGTYRFTIKEVWDIDAGEYTCEVANVFGTDQATAKLTVQAPPVIERDVPNTILPLDEMVRFKIYFSGSAPFSHLLTLNKKEVSGEHPTIRTVEFDDHFLITITSLQPTETGRYEYTVSNDSGEATTGFWLNVTGLPTAPQGPLVYEAVTRDSVTLSWRPPVDDGGSRIKGYKIEKRDILREEWTTVASQVRELSYTAQALFEGHEYEFRVSAFNENGVGAPLVSDNSVVTKLPFDPPGPPTDAEVTHIGTDSLTLNWLRPISDGGGRLRGYVVEKREAGQDTWVRCNQTPSPPNNFTVPNLIDGREYEFQIFAVNDAGFSEPLAMDKLVFKAAGGGTPPEIISPCHDQLGETGRSVTFECEIRGEPRPEIKWMRGMKELVSTSKYTVLNKGTVQTLIIQDVQPDDADEYSCRAVNTKGTRTTRANLKIKSKPRVFVPPKYHGGYEAQKGETVDITLPYKAFPAGEGRWTKNGEKIEAGGKYTITGDDKTVTLRISNASREDYGNYRVTVDNGVGSDSATITVTVADRPDPPRAPQVENVLDEAVILSWKPPLLDGGSLVTGYTVEKRDTSGGQWTPCAKSRFTYLTVEGLKGGHQYEFRITAENKHGVSDPCEQTNAVTIPGDGRRRRRNYDVDESGKIIRGRGIPSSNYDSFVFDVWKHYYPEPVEISTASIYDKYDVLEEIGTGAFGVVHRCVERSTGNTFAAKFVNTPHQTDKDTVRKEIQVMNALRNPSLIHLHDAYEDQHEMVMVYEFLSGGELFEKIADEHSRMSEKEAADYTRQVCEALRVMHENNYVHLDLKPENIMFTTKKSDKLKLIDFGLATQLDPRSAVKVTTGTAEFAAPEIANGEPVGYYTDMWSVGVLSYILLSGLSPFGGETDEETLKNVRAGDWSIDDPAFSGISDHAKDFVKQLLHKDPKQRLSVFDALDHPWLTSGEARDDPIPSSRYRDIRDSVKRKYDAWPEPMPPLGRIANYSSLRKLRPTEYSIRDAYFDRQEATPRFIVRPFSTSCAEGHTATFYCRVLAASPPIVTWHHGAKELRQSVKYMKKYEGSDYSLVINRAKMEDKGEYTVRAQNSYGAREETVSLTVTKQTIDYEPKPLQPMRKMELPKVEEFKEKRGAPKFSFHLRHRLIQKNHPCKLICNLGGNPTPKVEWLKDGRAVDADRVQLTYRSGVASLEIFNARMEDSGTYTCVATNELGEDSTECLVTVQGRGGSVREPIPDLSSFRPRRDRDSSLLRVNDVESA
ncbi:unnamed protein product, partial [Mesorhabditis spiculigera]